MGRATSKVQKWSNSKRKLNQRQGGAYLSDAKAEEIIQNPDTIIALAQHVKPLKAMNQRQAAQIEADRPKTIFADSITNSNNTILIREPAKILCQNGMDTGEKRLFAWLRNNGYLIKKRGATTRRPRWPPTWGSSGWPRRRSTGSTEP